MGVSVAEYLGHNVRSVVPIIPANYDKDSIPLCPFRNGRCEKVAKGLKPVCSVLDSNSQLWVVCEHRLCATSPKDAPLSSYQSEVLLEIARTLWGSQIGPHDVMVKREVPVRTVGRNSSSADYVMAPTPSSSGLAVSVTAPVVLEMQGGGETSNTGALSKVVDDWEKISNVDRTNNPLTVSVAKVGTIEANAWRRQQEQFLYKGNVAVNSGGRLVFAVGSKLFDYLMNNLAAMPSQDLSKGAWTLAILRIVACDSTDKGSFGVAGSLSMRIDDANVLFTSYSRFVNALINQGGVDGKLFKGVFTSLNGNEIVI